MNSRIYTGEVMHARATPVRHTFRYPVYFFGLDLDELPALDRDVAGFGHNRFRPASIHDRDYLLDREDGPIRERLERHFTPAAGWSAARRVVLVTSARYFGYVFNPVSFYVCLDAGGAIVAVAAEVNNTFGERHLYALESPSNGDGRVRFITGKAFHVSPFNDMAGHYEFEFASPGDTVDIRISLVRDSRTVMTARLTGAGAPLDSRRLRRTLLRHPLTALLTMPRIVWQAGRLYVGRKLTVHPKPDPSSPRTIRTARPTLLQRLGLRLARTLLASIGHGRLELALPDGTRESFGPEGSGPAADLRVRRFDLFRRLLLDADVGLGEGYVAGDWDSADLTGLVRLFIDNRAHLSDEAVGMAAADKLFHRWRHRARANTLVGSRVNIGAHYNLSNSLYRLFLDESMMYSCAIFAREDETLEDAQSRKLDAIIRQARIGAEHHVLEIGSGWGGFAIEAVRVTGCRVTSITLSEQQLALAREKAAAAGLADRIEFRLQDYRTLDGRFDRIVSIEMLEAVGHAYFGSFFAALERLLAPDGLAVIQTITIPDQRYDNYRRNPDWIQLHIFPGGELPSLHALIHAMVRHSTLVIERQVNIGPHYAWTLREWRRRFLAHRDQVLALGFDEAFIRKWEYYLCYCEAAFAARYLGNLQLVLTRPGNRSLPVVGEP
jgi:cyclopropane-fatty-acyl-phospholipid synthase